MKCCESFPLTLLSFRDWHGFILGEEPSIDNLTAHWKVKIMEIAADPSAIEQ
jgi:hypothetical protein